MAGSKRRYAVSHSFILGLPAGSGYTPICLYIISINKPYIKMPNATATNMICKKSRMLIYSQARFCHARRGQSWDRSALTGCTYEPYLWGRQDLNLRRLRRRVYSPLPLATRALPLGLALTITLTNLICSGGWIRTNDNTGMNRVL